MTGRNRLPVFYPSHINLYLQCPERYLHERIERVRPEQSFSPALAKGIAIHEILADASRIYRFQSHQGMGPAVPADLVVRAGAKLPQTPYASELAWNADVEAVVHAVKNGLQYLDGQAQVVATEATYRFSYLRGEDCPDFTLASKVDLVLLKQNADGRPFLDVIDYKSGASPRHDSIQELASRIVVKQNAAQLGHQFDYIQSTTLHVAAGTARSAVLDDDECGMVWRQMKGAVSSILQGENWEPVPSPLCEWCPFFDNGCSLTPEGQASGDMASWLDSVAV